MPNVGHVYILLNPSHKLLKIGKTTKTPEERATELSSTGVPAPFVVAHSEKVSDCDLAETRIHTELAAYRINGDREFFSVTLKEAIRVVSKVAENFQIRETELEKGWAENKQSLTKEQRAWLNRAVDAHRKREKEKS